jgi:release factor glutamine methyltransferase
MIELGVFSDQQSAALVQLGRELRRSDYKFVTITPASHARVLARARLEPSLISSSMLGCLERAEVLARDGSLWRALVRFSTLGPYLFVHSGFPTSGENSVFFGPDTYRFVRFIQGAASASRRIVDVGCGTGAGGIALSALAPERLVLCDVNPSALAFARINAELAGVAVELIQSDILNGVPGELDLIVANPPYMSDDAGRTYRQGGGAHGEALSIRIVREALPRLASAGTLLLYTGAPVVAGVDVFYEGVREPLAQDNRVASVSYEELDVDVFGEELSTPAYADVDRIAAVALTVKLSAS